MLARQLAAHHRYSGLFDPKATQFVIVSWNARALSHRSAPRRRKKFSRLLQYIKNADVACLQEVHGTVEEMRFLFLPLVQHGQIFPSQGVNRATGGLTTLIAESFARLGSITSDTSYANGRISRTTFTSPERTNIFWNVRNEKVSAEQIRKTTAAVRDDTLHAANAPLAFCVWVVVDWILFTPR